ncbi:MAG TPA: hypothetical protein VMX35_08920 [Acidobacteriota bacterium]|nr:hypothetical protein [Acidobacteriota bacterium]
MMRILLATALVICLCAAAQADVVHLVDGRSFKVSSWRVDGDYLVMTTEKGEIRVLRHQVERIEVEGLDNEEPVGKTVIPFRFREGTDLLSFVPEERRFAVPASVLSQASRGNIAAALVELDSLEVLGNEYTRSPDYLLLKTALLLRAGLLKEAEDLIAPVIDSSPREGFGRYLAGQAAYLQGRWQEALEHYRASLLTTMGGADQAMRSRVVAKLVEMEGEYRSTVNQSEHFVLHATTPLDEQQTPQMILQTLEDLYGPLSAALEASLSGKVAVIASAEIPTAPDGTRREGSYDGRIVFAASAIGSGRLKRILAHELVHALLLPRTRGNCAVWIHEGLAQFLSGVSTEEIALELKATLEAGQTLGLYPDSLTLIEFLLRSHSAAHINNLLTLLAAGSEPDQAIQRTFGRTLDELRLMRDNWLAPIVERAH